MDGPQVRTSSATPLFHLLMGVCQQCFSRLKTANSTASIDPEAKV